jgi:hypothetical protein
MLPNAWWCAGIRRSARQQERDKAWALHSRSYRRTPKNEGFPTPSAPAASSDRVIGAQDHLHERQVCPSKIIRASCAAANRVPVKNLPFHHLLGASKLSGIAASIPTL